ncbi:MAG: ATPase, T2SS/T4P/T4SS family [Myxococcota bacterium]|nr:ATPase, T2SS/T4P/T4SS family [Myxococcota bacterium]
MSTARLGELLLQRTNLTRELLDAALVIQEVDSEVKLGMALVRLGAVSEEEVTEALAEQLGIERVDPLEAEVDPKLVWRLNRSLAVRSKLIPLTRDERGRPRVAMANPQDPGAIRDLEFAFNGPVVPLIAEPTRISQAIQRHFSVEAVAARLLDGVQPHLRELTVAPNWLQLDADKIQRQIHQGDGRAAVDLVDLLLINAIERGASDIHLEPGADDLRVRYRIDGLLREMVRLPQWSGPLIAGRVKVISDLNVAERRRAQDGKARARLGGRTIELRVSILPAQFGENIVIRVLDPEMVTLSLSQLGWSDAQLKLWYRLLSRPRGLVLVVGPTGSGKSTTLYASIHRLNRESLSVATLEDPIEYTLPGITQVQINDKAGVHFANSVRALLRQDPNVIVIGEVRDAETAAAAVDASGTGHLVLSTLHTSNAVAAVTRMLDLEVPGYLLGAAMAGVVSQRLVRRVCTWCSLPADHTPEEWLRLDIEPLELGPAARRAGPGCPHCQYVGYSGRVGLYELLELGPDISAAVQKGGVTEAELWELARAAGMRTLFEDALDKLRAGVTTLEEVARVVPVGDYPVALRQSLVDAERVQAEREGPIVQAVDTQVSAPLPSPRPKPPREARPATAPETGRPLVLVVDDAPEIRDLVALTLEDDCEILQAEDGQEALEQVQAHRPDLLVLDVMMPRKTGYEVCTALKADPETADIPVLMLSARGETRHVKQGLMAGADDYLPKPFDPEELLLRVQALLRRARR